MVESSLRQLKLENVIDGCRDESRQPRSQETGYCLELFRRALEDKEQAAWTAIDQQYKNLILHWISCRAPSLSNEEAQDIVPQALPKFWHILSRSSAPLTDRFSHVGAVLKYLKRCAISVLRDHERRLQRRKQLTTQLASAEPSALLYSETEQDLLTRIDQEQLVALVKKWIETYITDPAERQVLSLSFEYGLTPAQIAQQYPQDFADVQTVRRIKERILKRAKRALGHLDQTENSPVLVNEKALT